MNYSERSQRNLVGVHRALVSVLDAVQLHNALPADWSVQIVEGRRTAERQRELVAEGKSWTMNSRHLTGHAVDLVIFDQHGKPIWDMPHYEALNREIQAVSRRNNIQVTWGGSWKVRDGLHWQLSWEQYPLAQQHKTVANSRTIKTALAGIPMAAFLPDAIQGLSELTGVLKSVDSFVTLWLQIVAVLLVVGVIVYERSRKIKAEGV